MNDSFQTSDGWDGHSEVAESPGTVPPLPGLFLSIEEASVQNNRAWKMNLDWQSLGLFALLLFALLLQVPWLLHGN